jgi:hypothetical protein
MYRTMTWQEFVDNYKPIPNKIGKNTNGVQTNFETYGEEVDFVFAQPDENVWTEVDVDGGVYVIAGKHYVNRIQYYVTEKPYDSDDQEVVISFYNECVSCGSYGGYGTNDDGSQCEECDNDDMVIYPETRDELEEVLGEEYANVTV